MKYKRLFELVLLGACWGPSYMFIKLALEEASPFVIAAGRVALAAIILQVIVRLRGRKIPRLGRIWWRFLVAGLFANSIPFILFGFSELYITSALAGVINGTTPIMTCIIAHFAISDERMTRSRVAGIAVATMGFCALCLPALFAPGSNGRFWGMSGVALASLSYAVGMVYGRKYLRGLPPLVAPACQLLVSALYLVPIALATQGVYPTQITWVGVGSIGMLGLLGTASAFWIYYRILEHSGAGYLSMATYLLPLFATILGAIFLGEKLSYTAYIAGAFILLGMMLVGGTVRLPRRFQSPPINVEPEIEP